jgi:hypothetical protein
VTSISQLFRFAVLGVVTALGAGRVDGADSEIRGFFRGNDQPALLAFVSAQKGKPVGGKEVIKLVFTEKDHAGDAEADLKALFGHYGSALVIGIQPDGTVVTCDVRHQAHKQKSISAPGSIKMSDFKSEGGQISGRIATEGKAEAFGETWEVDIRFKTKAP